jgi:hypothetical protein
MDIAALKEKYQAAFANRRLRDAADFTLTEQHDPKYFSPTYRLEGSAPLIADLLQSPLGVGMQGNIEPTGTLGRSQLSEFDSRVLYQTIAPERVQTHTARLAQGVGAQASHAR